ncbi:MAG: histidine phosphatase family protein [Candidatus Pacebacteria bacterium]|nr:histidine phosphatase family protein [Candidatus Paceibacterota bacterium]
MKIFLIRHGQTTGDIEDRYGGDYDDHLTEEGKRQIAVLAKNLSNRGIEIIFSSPKIRAKETSEILKNTLSCDIEVFNNFRERSAYGALTGMIKREAREKYPEQAELLKDYKNTIEGAESYENFKERIKKAFLEITNQNYNTIAIITHGGPIKCLFREFFKWGELKELGDCAFFEIEKAGDKFLLTNIDNASLE